MAEIVNLRLARKAKQRAVAERQASANRAKNGLTRAEKARREAEAALQASRLEGHRREED